MTKRIPRAVVAVGWAMMFSSSSYIMVLAIFGVYLKSIGVTQTKIGFLEGSVEAISLCMKLFSGVFSDFIQNRRSLILMGYGLTSLSRPFIALSTTVLAPWIGPVLGGTMGRIMDRLGNGLQATPRDVWIGELAPPHKRGQCFGLARSMGTFGAIWGSIIAHVCMKYFSFGYEDVFMLSIVPAMLGLFIITGCTRKAEPAVKEARQGFQWSSLKKLGGSFAALMVVNAVFMLARLGETAMSLHATINFGLPGSYSLIIMVIYNMGYTLSSYPIGFLADKTNRSIFLALGIFSLILADLIFFAAEDVSEFWVAVLLWGVQVGVTTNIFVSLIVDITPKELHGTALGCYWLISAICVLMAESYGGYIAEHYGNRFAYLTSALIGAVSLLLLVIFVRSKMIRENRLEN